MFRLVNLEMGKHQHAFINPFRRPSSSSEFSPSPQQQRQQDDEGGGLEATAETAVEEGGGTSERQHPKTTKPTTTGPVAAAVAGVGGVSSSFANSATSTIVHGVDGVSNIANNATSTIVNTSNKVRESVKDTFRDFSLFDEKSLKKRRKKCHRKVTSKVMEYKLTILFVLWILVGWIFYNLHPGIGEGESYVYGIGGYYQSITIGYSVGLAPRNPLYFPSPWFSSAYILVGATLIAVILNSMGQSIDHQSSITLFEDLKRLEKYQTKIQDTERPFLKKVKTFIRYNAGYLIIVLLWLLWLGFIIIWSMQATKEWDEPWDFKKAQYFAVSLCSSAGAFSLPDFSPQWAYGMAGLSMMIGVPLMALAISAIVMMTGIAGNDNYPEKVHKAAWTPISQKELQLLQQIGLGHALRGMEGGPRTMIDGEVISKGDYVLLGVLRMGTEAGLIRYFCDAYDTALEERGCVPMETAPKKSIKINDDNDDDDDDDEGDSPRRLNLSSCAAAYVTEEENESSSSSLNHPGKKVSFDSTTPMTTMMMMGSIPEDSTAKSGDGDGGGGGGNDGDGIVTTELRAGMLNDFDRLDEKNQQKIGKKQWSTLGDMGDGGGGGGFGGEYGHERPSMDDLNGFSMANIPEDYDSS